MRVVWTQLSEWPAGLWIRYNRYVGKKTGAWPAARTTNRPGFCLSHTEQKGYIRYPHCLHLEQSNYLSRIFSSSPSFPRQPTPGGSLLYPTLPPPLTSSSLPLTRNLKINRRRRGRRRSAKRSSSRRTKGFSMDCILEGYFY